MRPVVPHRATGFYFYGGQSMTVTHISVSLADLYRPAKDYDKPLPEPSVSSPWPIPANEDEYKPSTLAKSIYPDNRKDLMRVARALAKMRGFKADAGDVNHSLDSIAKYAQEVHQYTRHLGILRRHAERNRKDAEAYERYQQRLNKLTTAAQSTVSFVKHLRDNPISLDTAPTPADAVQGIRDLISLYGDRVRIKAPIPCGECDSMSCEHAMAGYVALLCPPLWAICQRDPHNNPQLPIPEHVIMFTTKSQTPVIRPIRDNQAYLEGRYNQWHPHLFGPRRDWSPCQGEAGVAIDMANTTLYLFGAFAQIREFIAQYKDSEMHRGIAKRVLDRMPKPCPICGKMKAEMVTVDQGGEPVQICVGCAVNINGSFYHPDKVKYATFADGSELPVLTNPLSSPELGQCYGFNAIQYKNHLPGHVKVAHEASVLIDHPELFEIIPQKENANSDYQSCRNTATGETFAVAVRDFCQSSSTDAA